MSSSYNSKKKKYKKRRRNKDSSEITDTEFYRDVEGGDPHTGDVLTSITGN